MQSFFKEFNYYPRIPWFFIGLAMRYLKSSGLGFNLLFWDFKMVSDSPPSSYSSFHFLYNLLCIGPFQPKKGNDFQCQIQVHITANPDPESGLVKWPANRVHIRKKKSPYPAKARPVVFPSTWEIPDQSA